MIKKRTFLWGSVLFLAVGTLAYSLYPVIIQINEAGWFSGLKVLSAQFRGINYDKWLAIISSMVTIIAAYATIVSVKPQSKKILFNNKYYHQMHEFVDREDELQCIIDNLMNKPIINPFGPKGVGKSSVLRCLADLINERIQLNNKHDVSVPEHFMKGQAIYIELTPDEGASSILNRLAYEISGSKAKSSEELVHIVQEAQRAKNMLLFIDNINSVAQQEELIKAIIRYQHKRESDRWVLGSVEPITVYGVDIAHCKLEPFEEEQISEYMHSKGAPAHIVNQELAEKYSHGFPIYLDFICALGGKEDTLFLKKSIKDEIRSRIESLKAKERQLFQHLAYQSLSEREILEAELIEHFFISPANLLESLEGMALINRSTGGYKNSILIHDLVREAAMDMRSEYDVTINYNLFRHYESQGRSLKAATHLVLSGCYEDNPKQIESLVERQISINNLPFLANIVALYRHTQDGNSGFKLETDIGRWMFFAHIYSLAGIGEYKASKDLIQSLVFSNTSIRSLMALETMFDYKFHLLAADVDHLNNDYKEASEISFILSNHPLGEKFPELRARSAWLAAHCERHTAKDLLNVEEQYRRAVTLSKEVVPDIFLRSVNELMTIQLVKRNWRYPYEKTLKNARKIAAKDQTLDIPLGSMMRTVSWYYRCVGKIDQAMELANESLELMEKIHARTIFDSHMAIGENFRLSGQGSNAVAHYSKALSFSKLNEDMNLFCDASLGIIFTEMGKLLGQNSSKVDEMEKQLREVMTTARRKDLFLAQQQIEIALDYCLLRNNRISDSDFVERLQSTLPVWINDRSGLAANILSNGMAGVPLALF